MHKFMRYFAVAITIALVILASTTNASLLQIKRKTPLSNTTLTQQTRNTNKPEGTGAQRSSWWLSPIGTGFGTTDAGSDFSRSKGSRNELVIGVNNGDPTAHANILNQISMSQGKVINTVSIAGRVTAIVADISPDLIPTFTSTVQSMGFARYVEPRAMYQASFMPNDPYWDLQWGPQIMKTDWAWNATTGNRSVLVAVVDTGIDYTHPDLAANYVPLGYDWVNMDDDPLDDAGHGTHVSGTIAATINNGVGVAGIGNFSIMAEKALHAEGYGYEDWLANAIIDAADKGANIISNSWGGGMDSQIIHDAVKYAYSKGALIIAAAGNSGGGPVGYPAKYPEVIAVSATDEYDNIASFSSVGPEVDLSAPGVDIYSTMPTYHVTMNDYGYTMNYSYMSGTSMACPHVSGLAALTWSRFPNATRDWIKARLTYTATDLGTPGLDDYYGYGRIDAQNAVEASLPSHDLRLLDNKEPRHVQPGETVLLNASLLNFGANDEQNVTVELLADGNLTSSQLISHLARETSVTVTLSWTPMEERIYNITYYVVPVFNETEIENNALSVMVPVKHIVGYVLFDQGHYSDPMYWYSTWTSNLTNRGYAVDPYTGRITPELLGAYDIFVSPQPWFPFDPDEISALQDFVMNGGGLLVIGDDYPNLYTSLTGFADINWDYEFEHWYGNTSDITPHNVTSGVGTAYFGMPLAQLRVLPGAVSLIRGGYYNDEVMLAASEMGGGRVLAIADEETIIDGPIMNADNLVLANNMINWLKGMKYQHELVASLSAPSYLAPEESITLNATVFNKGLSNETEVQLQILINSTIVSNVTIPQLVNGSRYTLNYPWTTPNATATYNITAYAVPVPDENVTTNNRRVKLVLVHNPLFNPTPGQYANYLIAFYDSSGNLYGTGFWNITYDHYTEPHKIYVQILVSDSSGYTFSAWMVVNTMTRYVETGNAWVGLWYPAWIEKDVGNGSVINLLFGPATISGSRFTMVGPRAIDCWEILYDEGYNLDDMLYDRATGLWISMDSVSISGYRFVLSLASTNVPIGTEYEHDLGVTLNAPPNLQPGQTSLLTATVYNVGLNNEKAATLLLLLNDTIVASITVPQLNVGSSQSINYSWTPTTEGFYNITAFAEPVASENITMNNRATQMVIVRSITVALISDWSDLTSLTPILDSMGIGYQIYNDNRFYFFTQNLSLLQQFKTVIFGNYERAITSAEHSALESYLAFGGNLLVTGYDSLGSPDDALLADIVRSSTTGDDAGQPDLYVVDGNHPIMNGPYGVFPAGYHIYGLYGDCDRAEADVSRGAVTVAQMDDGYDRIIATEGLPGKVVYWNGQGSADWLWNADAQAMFKNILHWFTVRYEHELTVSLIPPRLLKPGSSALLNATVKNRGLNPESNVALQLFINGTIVASTVIPQLANGSDYTISHLWSPETAGTYNITVYAPPVPSENITSNNALSRLIPVRIAPRILAYVQYTDTNQDYPNTLAAIESSYGPYELTELWDYTQLDTMLQGKDILLVLDQEYASFNQTEAIGNAWAMALTQFLGRGGTIIVCDGGWGFGTTYGILTGAGLMQISWVNYRTGSLMYVNDPNDPLAEGLPAFFYGPTNTISYVTSQTGVVTDEYFDPAVIRQRVGGGNLVLLGFDFFSSTPETKQILGNAIALGLPMTISIEPSVGPRGAQVTLNGTRASPNGTVSVYWDGTFMANTAADDAGDFSCMLTVPNDATAGTHEILAVDAATNRTASALFTVFLMVANPAQGPPGTKVTVNGFGFSPTSQITVTFNDMFIGYGATDGSGNFAFTFNVPLSTVGTQTIKASDADGHSAWATFTVIDDTPLGVQIDVGALHFLGEIAEFYAQTTFDGEAVNATITSALLYKPDGTTENLTASQLATGLYKILYTIVGSQTGTYTLVLTASYATDTVQSTGTSFKSFLVSNTLSLMNSRIVTINNGIATVQTDMGLVKLDLTAMNATLENIFVKVLAINGTTATLQTTIGIVNGTITDMQGDYATIMVPGIGQIKTDVSSLRGTQEGWIIPAEYLTVALVMIAAAGSALSAVFVLRRRRTPEQK